MLPSQPLFQPAPHPATHMILPLGGRVGGAGRSRTKARSSSRLSN